MFYDLSRSKSYCKCKRCGCEKAEVDTSVVLTSFPPQYSYKCPECGEFGYIFCDELISVGSMVVTPEIALYERVTALEKKVDALLDDISSLRDQLTNHICDR